MATGPLLCHKEKMLKLVFIDKNSIKAVKEGNFREIHQAREKLEKEGFGWSGRQKCKPKGHSNKD